MKAKSLLVKAGWVILAWMAGGAMGRGQITRQDAKLNLPAELPSASAYTTEDAFGPGMRFHEPVAIASQPGEKDRIFVVEKKGTIQMVTRTVVTRTESTYQKKQFFDINAILQAKYGGRLVTESEMGLLGLAFHPDFARNGYFYVTYDFAADDGGGKQLMYDRLSRFRTMPGDPTTADPNSEQPMITQLDDANNHNGGDIHFGPDGYLYYSVGDEGNQFDHYDNARFIDKDFFAAIYRLDVDRRPGNLAPNPHSQASGKFPSAVSPGSYSVPADNPFVHATVHNGKAVDVKKIRTEIWACGLRNPWRFSFDPATGRMFIGDVGQNEWEEVDIGQAGGNFGWSYFEGTHWGPRHNDLPAGETFIPPIYEYEHGEGSVFKGISVIGGVVYRGDRLPELKGTYVFGDFGTRHLWGLAQLGTKWVPRLLDTFGGVAAFGVDPGNGDVLAVDLGGNIGRLVRATGKASPPPARLSDTKIFTDMKTLAPAPGMVEYGLIQPQWAGRVAARHWFGIPNGSKMEFSTQLNWEFPEGTTWVQHFDTLENPPRKLETRILVKTRDGCYGVTYKWRADQSDADLVPEGGAMGGMLVAGLEPGMGYRFPAQAECMLCHSAAGGYALGFNTWNLNRPGIGAAAGQNQVQALLDSGYAENRRRDRDTTMHAFAAQNDAGQPLELRARSYLAVNCSGCHQPGGMGLGTWDALPGLSLEETRIVDGGLINNLGDAKNRVAAPGDPLHSMLLKRMEGNGAPKMPMGGTMEVDEEGVKLINAWIQTLPAGR